MAEKKSGYVPPVIGAKPNKPGGGRLQPVVKPKNMKGTLKRLWGYFSRERKHLVFVFFFVLLSTVVSLAAPYLIGRAVDQLGLALTDAGPLVLTACLLAGCYALDAVSSLMQGFLMAGISQRTVRVLRTALFDHFQKLPVSFFDARQHGDLMSRLTNDIDNISSTISSTAAQLMSLVVALVGSLVMMLILSPVMTLAMALPAGLAVLLTRTVTKRTAPLFRKQQAELGRLTAQLEESASGLTLIRGFNREQASVDEFSELNQRYYKASLMALIWSGLLMPLTNVISNLSLMMIAALGSGMALEGLATVGTIASFISYSRQLVRPLNEVASLYNTLQTAVAGAERVFEIFDSPEETGDAKDAQALGDIKGDVSFKDVSFSYRAGVNVLDKISFDVPRGSSLALVGATGAGKTTIVNLLARFYEVSGGEITIDGRDITRYTRASLRQAFGIVLQDTYLFTGTIRENIRYGNPEESDAAVEEAARRASADEFIRRLPRGYDTLLSESGSNLSGGQRQLLAIARAILNDAPILILDEATSNVDTRTELRIQQAMLKLMKGRTTFLIAHRLSTISGADRILVIDGGKIVETGSHKELLGQNGVYAKMWNSQLANAG